MNTETRRKKPFFKRRKVQIILAIVLVLVIIRLILPYVILHYANKTLAHMHGYYGHIQDIDLALYRGAYQIKQIYIDRIDSVSQKEIKFFDAKEIDLAIEWRSLFHGRLVGNIEFERPVLRFTKDKADPSDIKEDSSDFISLLDKFMPLKVNRCEIRQGVLRYMDQTSKPPVDLQMNAIHVLAQNLSNVRDTALLPSSVVMHADVYRGYLSINARINALKRYPTFDLNAEIKDTYLPDYNTFFKAYGNLDVNKGNFGIYTEMAAREGMYKGYVKPLIKDLDILGPEDKDDKLWQKFYEGAVGTGGTIFSNYSENQVATKIPVEGQFKTGGKTDLWYAIGSLLRNAFIRALVPAIDYEINISSVGQEEPERKGLLNKLFGNKPESDKTSDKKRRKKIDKN